MNIKIAVICNRVDTFKMFIDYMRYCERSKSKFVMVTKPEHAFGINFDSYIKIGEVWDSYDLEEIVVSRIK